MSWNFIATAPHGTHSDGLYPIPTKAKPYVETEPGDGAAEQWDVWSLSRQRLNSNGDPLEKPVHAAFSRPQPKLIATESRIIFVQPKLGVTKRGQSMIGHIRFPWIGAVAARPWSPGSMSAAPALAFIVEDGLSSNGDLVRIEIDLNGRVKTGEIAHAIVKRAVDQRVADAATPNDVKQRLQDPSVIAPFDMQRKTFTVRSLPGALTVGPT